MAERTTESFVVKIIDQQNATWQGSITRSSTKETLCFRSALELIKLMDSALDKTMEAPHFSEPDGPKQD